MTERIPKWSESGTVSPPPTSTPCEQFLTLCARYSGDVPPTTLLKELRHVGAVEEGEDGRLVAKSRVYIPVLMDPEQMLRSGSVMGDIGDTVAYNLHRRSDDPSRFERRATNTNMPEETVAEFREFLEQEGQAFLERVDGWLSEHECNETDNSNRVRLGFGGYWIEEALEKGSGT